MSPLAIVAAIGGALFIALILRSGVRADADIARQRAQEDERRRGDIPHPDWELMKQAHALGVQLDIPADTVTVAGQAAGRFTGSLVRVETYGQINRRVTATRVALVGIFALAAQKKQDDRELYLTVEGDGFQIAARVRPDYIDAARRFAAEYNTRSGALARSETAVGVAGQLSGLARLHAAGQLTDQEFAAAKAQLLGAAPAADQPRHA